MKKNNPQLPTEQFLPVAELINPYQLLETVQLLVNGLITEDEFLKVVGYDIPVVTNCIYTANPSRALIAYEQISLP